MPRNRACRERGEKEEELLDAAEVAFVGSGWDGTTMSAIARAAGVTATTVRWYFPSKDAVLAAVVRRWAEVTVTELEEVSRHVAPAVVAGLVVATVDQLQPLLAPLRERSQRSAVVADALKGVRERLIAVLAHDPASPDAVAAATEFVLLVEAILGDPIGGAQPPALADHALEAYVGALARNRAP